MEISCYVNDVGLNDEVVSITEDPKEFRFQWTEV